MEGGSLVRAIGFALAAALVPLSQAHGHASSKSDTAGTLTTHARGANGDSASKRTRDTAKASSDTHKAKPPSFLARLAAAYAADYGPADTTSSPPARRLPPAPLDAPPFPNEDWTYGGSPDIGAENPSPPPLTQALYSGANGKAWQATGIQIYGWVNGGFNLSTSHASNAPAAYYARPNGGELDQIALYIERDPNTVQTDHVDWGFRLTNLYGENFRYTITKGIFSHQLLVSNNYMGYDPVMAYFDLYVPKVAQGMNIRVGRYISLPDIEAQLAPNNYTYSHSLLYSYDAYTQTGINTTTMFNFNWMLQVGISAGNDVAPWQPHDAKPTLNTCLRWTSTSGNDNLYPCLNSLNDGKYAYNNVQSIYNTWYHKFNATWHTDTEWWYMWEKDVPNVLNPAAAHLLETNANGAMCDSPKQLTCFAPEWAVVNYLEKELSRRDYISIRNEYFDDIKGQRTGFKTRYTEHLLGWGHWIGTTITIRPELRFERSYDMPAYDLGRKSNQFIFASDIIIKY